MCDWRTEYCTGDVERDDAGQWACLASCAARDAEYDAYGACTCSPQGAALIPDGQYADWCFYGDPVTADAWTPPPGYGSGGVWASPAKFRESLPSVSLYVSPSDTGYATAKSSFLQLNCPPMRPVRVLRPDPSRGGALAPFDAYINACGCRKGADAWMEFPAPQE